MAKNVEIKARIDNLERLEDLVEELSDKPAEEIYQDDIFFMTDQGRFKLRMLSANQGQLIYYDRVDQAGPKLSNYTIYETSDPEGLIEVLSQSLGVRGRVRKRRRLYWSGNTRIHLDEVEGLGGFIEVEVVLEDDQSQYEGMVTAAELMERLRIRPADLIKGAYIDMLEER